MTRSATVADDDRPIDAEPYGTIGSRGTLRIPQSKLAAYYHARRTLGRDLSVSELAELTGDLRYLDSVIAAFVAEENAKVARAMGSAVQTRCGRCDHLRRRHSDWPGPCSWPGCSCPGPEPAG